MQKMHQHMAKMLATMKSMQETKDQAKHQQMTHKHMGMMR